MHVKDDAQRMDEDDRERGVKSRQMEMMRVEKAALTEVKSVEISSSVGLSSPKIIHGCWTPQYPVNWSHLQRWEQC